MKKRNHREKLVAEINITPFTDVILVLLIIFMITTPLIGALSIKVDLPQMKTGTPRQNTTQAQANITITNKGVLYLENQPVSAQELKKKITLLYKDNPDLAVILHSDKAVQFQEIVTIFDLFSELGITKLSIAATQKTNE